MELLRILVAGGAGCVIGFVVGYLIGSDNGFAKDKECEEAKGGKQDDIKKSTILFDVCKGMSKEEILYEGRDYEGGNED